MNLNSIKEKIKHEAEARDALAFGVARADVVDERYVDRYLGWLAKGHNAGMTYASNHIEIRRDPRLLLPGARSIISLAFGYTGNAHRDPSLPSISEYALLPDYHDWVREICREIIKSVSDGTGLDPKTDFRICVDSAPIFERYWAQKAGVGFTGRNGNIITERGGSRVILAEILTTLNLEADLPYPDERACGNCSACVRACPTGALQPDGTLDCNRCLSYLTIEHRGEWNLPVMTDAMGTPAGRHTLFGCDRCVKACPHNWKNAEAPVQSIAEVCKLTSEYVRDITPEQFSILFKGTALKRAKAEGLKRNALNCLGEKKEN